MLAKEIHAGDRYGRLRVLYCELLYDRVEQVLCECKCGRQIWVSPSLLQCGIIKSCGCTRNHALDLTEAHFGRLTAVEPVPNRAADGSICWKCRCACGHEVVVSSNHLRMGHTTSCGCVRRELLQNSKTYTVGTCLEIINSSKISANNTSGRKGVARKRDKWQAYISFGNQHHSLGAFSTMEEACRVRSAAEDARDQYIYLLYAKRNTDIQFTDVLREYVHKSDVALRA